MKEKLKNAASWIFIGIAVACGLVMVLYPKISNIWNEKRSGRSIEAYDAAAADLDDSGREAVLLEARNYNASIEAFGGGVELSDEDLNRYYETLDISGTGIMGYLDIPSIGVKLPIYHGTDESVLRVAAGHIPGSSLPVGGSGCHSLLSGHRGLKSARLFTDLDQLKEGDLFCVTVIGEELWYRVCEIRIVLPEEVDGLGSESGRDLCTLITCTPYGVNTHRILVTGERTEAPENGDGGLITRQLVKVPPLKVLSVLALPAFCLFFLTLFIPGRKTAFGDPDSLRRGAEKLMAGRKHEDDDGR